MSLSGILYQPDIAVNNDVSTLSAADVASDYHFLNLFPLDVQGAAAAFRWLHGYGAKYEDDRKYPGFAYDTRAGVWREWQFGKGWQDRGSVLNAMTNIVAALCALEAYRTNDSGSPDKTEREYKKLRQRYLGATVEKAVKLAAVETGVGSWDYDPNMLGLPKGEAVYIAPSNKTFPVHTGLEQLPTDYLTRKMAHGPKRTTRLWLDFLDSFTGGDLVLENALQVWTGATLLLGNDHHKAHILFGDGHTGKSTFLKIVQTAMGDYAASARPSIFVDEKANHPAELLPFVNHRLVVLPELPRGALRSDLLKTVTGGDAISVRGMRQNPRTETPAATLMFSCNELPSIRMVDNALRGRIMIWPFDNQPTKIDPTLGSRLQEPEHLAGVVGWLLAGLTKYVKIRNAGDDMPIPPAVQEATENYLDEADIIGQWANACTVDGGETQSALLYSSYSGWCQSRHRRPISETSFGLWMGRHYHRKRGKGGSTYPVSLVAGM